MSVEHLYIHVPYCSSKCHYCDFFSVIDPKDEFYIELLLKEFELYTFEYNLKTIYFGGGTPSIFKPYVYKNFLKKLKNKVNMNSIQEITMELNPKDYNVENLKELFDIGINRLSFGVQSFNKHHLKWLGRAHIKEDAIKSIENAKRSGFKNISIDIIWGLGSLKEFEEDIEEVLSFDLNHISFYLLTYYPNTPLYDKKNMEKFQDEICEFYELLREKMKDYIHYEISNFAKEEFISKHNMAYWEYKDYLGIGAGAVSKVHPYIFSNPKDINLYKENVLNKRISLKALNEGEHKKNKIMMGLRTIKGVKKYLVNIPDYLKEFFIEEKERVYINPKHWLISNTIISEVI